MNISALLEGNHYYSYGERARQPANIVTLSHAAAIQVGQLIDI